MSEAGSLGPSQRQLEKLLRPASVAVIGASPRSFMGSAVLMNLNAVSFEGPVIAVNPKYDEVMGYPAVPDVSHIKEPVDLAVVQTGARSVASLVKASVMAGIRNFIVPGAGHTDSGEVASELAADLQSMQRSHGILVVGPNTMGVVDLVTGVAPWVGTVPDSVRRGTVAVLSQSGAVAEAFVNAGGRIPISTVVSTGSEATVDLSDYLDFFAADPATSAVLIFVEGVRRPSRVLESLTRMEEAGKRVAVLVVGKSDVARSGILSHSGRLAPDYLVTRAAFRQAGAVVVDDLDELMAVGELFGVGIESIGNRAVFVVNSGGEGSMLADLAAEAGVELPPLSSAAMERLGSTWPGFRPANPLDPWGVADYGEVYATAIDAAAAEDVDLVLVAQDQQTTSGAYEHQLGLDLAHYLAEACKRHDRTAVFLSPSSHDPPVALSEQCRQHEVALLRGGRPGLQAIARLASRRWSLVTETGRPLQVSDIPELQNIDGVVEEDEALGVLDRFGVETPRRLGATTHEDCLRIATDIGYPVVLKGTGAAVAHKTELGLVHHGIPSEGSLLAALGMVDAAAGRLGLDIGYMVAEQVSGDLELLVGFHRDNTFGPTVVVGLGGVWAEALNVAAVRIGEIGPEQARDIIDESGVGRLLRNSRSGPLAVAAVVEVVTAVSELGRNHPAISAIDVNPVIVSRDRAVAVDALITIEQEPQNAEGERNDSE